MILSIRRKLWLNWNALCVERKYPTPHLYLKKREKEKSKNRRVVRTTQRCFYFLSVLPLYDFFKCLSRTLGPTRPVYALLSFPFPFRLFPTPQGPFLSWLLVALARLFAGRLAALLALERVRDVPVIAFAEAPGRMERVQRQHGHDHHDALEHDKVPLVLDQLALPPLRQLDDPVNAADENAHRGQRQRDQEAFEFRRGAQGGVAGFADVRGCAWSAASPGIPLGSDGKVEADEDEHGEGEHLEG